MVARKWLLLVGLALTTALVFGCGGPQPTTQPNPTAPPSGTGTQATTPGKAAAPAVPAAPSVAKSASLDGGAVTLKGYTIRKNPAGLTEIILYWDATKPLNGVYSGMLHMFPQDTSLLPADRKQYGFVNMDHEPAVPTAQWQPGKTYVSIHRANLQPGTYHALAGLYTAQGGKSLRLKPAQPVKGLKHRDIVNAVDLGKITVP